MNSALILRSISTSTIDYYNAHAEEYFKVTVGLDMGTIYDRFLHELPPGAHILDAGCGSGRDTKAFLQRGYAVTAFDGSHEMAKLASSHSGQTCSVLRFQEMQFNEQFDAIWTCASVLHVPKQEMAEVLCRFTAALKPGGIMYVSFIEGEEERRGEDGRIYNCYTPQSFRTLITQIVALCEFAHWKSDESSSSSKRAPWINFMFKKQASKSIKK